MSSELPIFMFNNHAISAFSMVGNTDSGVIDIAEASGYCVHAIYTGSPTGTITINASNDGINFSQIANQSLTGSGGQFLSNQIGSYYRYVRVNYVFSSGTGILDCYISGKRA